MFRPYTEQLVNELDYDDGTELFNQLEADAKVDHFWDLVKVDMFDDEQTVDCIYCTYVKALQVCKLMTEVSGDSETIYIVKEA
jgi:hypothetical protein